MHQNRDDTCPPGDDQRLREVARILAAAVLRLYARAALAGASGEHPGPKNLPESGPNGLEFLPETVLSVHTG